MSEIKGMLQCLRQINQKNLAIILALILWISFVMLTYSMKPQTFIASMASLGPCLFLLMVWLTYSINKKFPVNIQVLFWLKLQHKAQLFLSIAIFSFILGTLFALVGLGIALGFNLINQGHLFGDTLTSVRAIFSFLILLGLLPSAIGLGLLFQRIKIFSKRITIALLVFIVIIGAMASNIQTNSLVIEITKWLFPPVSLSLNPLSRAMTVDWTALSKLWMMNGVYGLIMLVILQWQVQKKGLFF